MTFELWLRFRNYSDDYLAGLITPQDLAAYKLFVSQYVSTSGHYQAGSDELLAAWYKANPDQRLATVADVKRLLGK